MRWKRRCQHLDFWLTLGKEEPYNRSWRCFLGFAIASGEFRVQRQSHCDFSAYFPKLPEAKRIKPGDEVITVAAGFPTTVAPICRWALFRFYRC